MRFKVDENLPVEAAELLNQFGHEALTVLQQKMRGDSDPKLIAVCDAEQRILVTFDLDFADIRGYPPSEHPGILVLRPASQAKRHVLTLLQRAIDHLSRESVEGCQWIVDEAGIRIR